MATKKTRTDSSSDFDVNRITGQSFDTAKGKTNAAGRRADKAWKSAIGWPSGSSAKKKSPKTRKK